MSHDSADTNSKRLRAAELEQETLYALGLFGTLATSQLARWVANDSRSAYIVQQRVIKRLNKHGLIMHRLDRFGRHMHYLTKPGAMLLRRMRPDGQWHHGHDLTCGSPDIQAQIFERALVERRAGNEVFGAAGVRAYGLTNP